MKVGLGRLLPREALRDQIERTAEALQALALRGSLVATTAVLEELRQGLPRPPIGTATWWQTCVASRGRDDLARAGSWMDRRGFRAGAPSLEQGVGGWRAFVSGTSVS